ncbi:taste receptor type 2 member 7-like [Pteronotus mesoamericanus]|uniref:taste receptor type 2 member 7-like n=1 Tax=Pteronotus mesoamericanus TaxID=1884717 RepID=UPI0023EAEC82|nr:taste receptor type 2 member 7-like [Pteronotus parnellii mesoamericanus]
MPSGTENILLIAIGGELITGMLGNGFIILVNCVDWVKGQKLSSVDCILTSLALSRITLLWITVFDSFIMVLWPHLYSIEKLANCIAMFWTLSHYLAAWFASSLSIFYFFRIANFSHPCFAWLRWRISKVLLVLPLASLFSLFLNLESIDSLAYLWFNAYKRHEKNSTWSSDVSKTLHVKGLIVSNFMYLIPFLLSLTSLFLLFLSLRRHTRNVQMNSSSRDFSTEAHKKAMKMVMSFLLLFTFHFSSFILTGWCYLLVKKQQANLVIAFTSTIFPSGHSFILILGNSKLRQTALELLWHLNCHLKKDAQLLKYGCGPSLNSSLSVENPVTPLSHSRISTTAWGAWLRGASATTKGDSRETEEAVRRNSALLRRRRASWESAIALAHGPLA